MKRTLFALAIAAMLLGGPAFGSTIATFADPSPNGSTPLFTVNSTLHTITGGWSDTLAGLNLILPITGNTYTNAYFILSDLSYTGSLTNATTSAGSVSFYKDGESPATVAPLLHIAFQSGQLSLGGVSADDVFTMNGITLSGRELGNQSFTDEVFAFSFSNITRQASGYTATAAFTSSAIVLPEPMTVAMLGLGMGVLALRKRA